MADLLLVENGSGGDVIQTGNDIVTTDTFCNQVYLALFGGNIEESHVEKEELVGVEQNVDWWGNDLFFESDETKKFISTTERLLYKVTLNSSGRKEIEQAVLFDLLYLDGFSEVDVTVSILGNDKLEIIVKLNQLANNDNKVFTYLWDNAKKSGLICGSDIDYNLLIDQLNEASDFNNDFNNDFSI